MIASDYLDATFPEAGRALGLSPTPACLTFGRIAIRLPPFVISWFGPDPWGRGFLTLALLWTLAMPLSIAIAEIALWSATLLWSANWLRQELAQSGQVPEAPTRGPAGDVLALIGTPLMAFWGVSVISALASRDPVESLWAVRDVFLFAAPLVTYLAYRHPRTRELGLRAFGAGVLAAILMGLVQTLVASSRGLFPVAYRPDGTFGHYMTYAGALMLAVPVLLTVHRGVAGLWHRLLALGALLLVGLTMTRSAWIGSAVALLVYALLRWVPGKAPRPRQRPGSWATWGVPLVVGVIVAAVVLLSLAGTEALYQRGASIFSLDNPTNRDRLAMAATGLRIIEAHPVLGVGPGLMERVYPAWRVEWAVKEENPHLHNNALQIAAERGLAGLATWLWLMAALAVGTWRVLRSAGPFGESGPEARAALAALAAFLAMGLFEYNFSDSEVLLILLYAVTLPFAASAGAARDASAGIGRG